MKIGIFTDAHYSPTERTGDRLNSLSLGKIGEALDEFRRQRVDACLCLGDLTDHCDSREDAVRCMDEILTLFEQARERYPIYVVPGNHDYSVWKREDFFRRVGTPCPPYGQVIGGCRFLFLDGNYDENSRSFDSFDFAWDQAYLSEEQLTWLAGALRESEEECVVLCHELIDPEGDPSHGLRNRERICRILEESGKVRLVLQGHYHPGTEHTVRGIRYIAYPAMCVGTENRYSVLSL